MHSKVILLLTCLLVFTVVMSAQAYEVVGGAIYTELDLPRLNYFVDHENNDLEWYEENREAEVEYMDNYDEALGYYIGIQYDITNKLKAGIQYEQFIIDDNSSSLQYESSYYDYERESYYYYTVKEETNLELDINGVAYTNAYQINKYLAINQGIGYYFGDFKAEYIYDGAGDAFYSSVTEYDLRGFGLTLGTTLDYDFASNWSLLMKANYRMADLDFENKEYAIEEFEDSFDGLEVNAGLSYEF